MKKFIALTYLFLCLHYALYSQQPFFIEMNIDPQNDKLKATAICQAEDGLIYIGTDEGLYRFDGFAFSKILLPDTSESKYVSHLTAIKNELLVCLNNGTILNLKKGTFINLKSPAKSPITSVFQNDNKQLWVASYGEGIFYRAENDWHRLSGIPDPFIYQLQKHPSGLLLAGSDAGLLLIDPSTNPISYKIFDSKKGLPDNIVKSIGVQPDGNVLLGLQEQGLFRFNMNNFTFENIEKSADWRYGALNCMVRLQNEFWVGTDGFGLMDFEFSGDRRLRNFDHSKGFPYKKVNALMRDREGNVWIAADHKLIYSPGEKVEFVNKVNNVSIDSLQSICTSKDGYVWFSKPDGLYRFDYLSNDVERIKKFVLDPKKKTLHITALHEDKFGYLWIGTFDDVLYRLNTFTEKVNQYSTKDGLENANVISINSGANVLWFATLGGVVNCSLPDSLPPLGIPRYEFKKYSDFKMPFNGFVYSIYIDSKNRTWFGTDGRGVVMYDGVSFKNFNELAKGKVVYSITEDLNGNMWFSTQNHGLYRYNGTHFRNFNLSHGLSVLDISGIETDNIGNILVVNSKGLDIIHPLTFEVEKIAGEAGIEKIDADLNTIARDRRGGVWIASRNGLFRFYNYNKGVSNKPTLILKAVYTFMKQSVNLSDSIFEYNQNNISIEYVGLWYSNPELVSYQYRLLGYSTSWIPTQDRIVTFPNLPPGKYTFEVIAGLGGQFNHQAVLTYKFRIMKPMWKENWFVLSIIVFVFLTLIFIIRDRDIRLRKLESLKKEKVEYQFATLKSQVNPHFLFNSFNTLIAIIESDKDNAISYVEKLSDYFRNLLQHRDKDVISLKEELSMVETYYFLQQKRFGDALNLVIDIPDDWLEKFALPPLSLQLLIENAVKHNAVSHESPLTVLVNTVGENSLVVKNTLNPKMNPEPSTGIGLQNIISRVQLVSGKNVNVSFIDDSFVVEIPLIKINNESTYS